MRDAPTLSRIVLPIAVIFASFSAIFIRWSQAPALIIAFYRMLFAFALVLPYGVYKNTQIESAGRKGKSVKKRKSVKEREGASVHSDKMSRRDIFLSVVSGIFLGVHFATWISSLNYTSVASSVLLVNTHPVMVFIISRFVLKEGGSKRELLFVLVTVLGSSILSWGDLGRGSNVLLGDLLAVLGALAVGSYMVLGRIVRRRVGVAKYTLIVYGISSLTLLIMNGAGGIPFYPYPAREFLLFFALAFVCTILGHSIYSWALKYVASTFLSVTVLIEPVAAGIMAFFLFGEVPSLLNGIGALIILYGIYGYSRASAQRGPAVAPRRALKRSSGGSE